MSATPTRPLDPSLDPEDAAIWGTVPVGARRRLIVAALEAFAAKGFHAATTREIAQGAGMSPAAVYVHYASKEDLLRQISELGHAAVLARVEQALAGAVESERRLRDFVEAFAAWHAEYHTLARVIQYEFSALPEEMQEQTLVLRQRFGQLMRTELRRGVEAGELDPVDVRGTSLAILSLCIDIARWYNPPANRTPAELGELYAELSLRMAGARA